MIYTPMTRKAIQIAYRAHERQTDQTGVPYIFHPYHIAEQMGDEITTCVALLHDVLEDTDMTYEELATEFPPEVMEPLLLLTHNKSEDYFDYVRKIAPNPVAKAVKLADIAHNSDQSRMAGLDIDPQRLEYWKQKYTKAKQILSEC